MSDHLRTFCVYTRLHYSPSRSRRFAYWAANALIPPSVTVAITPVAINPVIIIVPAIITPPVIIIVPVIITPVTTPPVSNTPFAWLIGGGGTAVTTRSAV